MVNLDIYHSNVHQTKGYVAMFGNQVYGEVPNPNEPLKSFWRKQLERSKFRSGDVALYYNGKLIRSVNNMQERILNKDIRFYCSYAKFK